MLQRIKNTIVAASVAWSKRTSLENPSTPIDAEEDSWGSWENLRGSIGEGTASGVKVSPEKALTYSPLWRGVNLISGDVAKLPCEVFAREGEGKRRATEHPAFVLLRRKPNREMKAYDFKKLMLSNAVIHGNGLAYIDRRGDGTPLELIPLRPGVCNAVRYGGVLFYVVEIGGEFRKLLPENVFHIKGLSPDGLMGYSLIDKAKESLGSGMAARDYGSRFFRNNARPSGLLEHPKNLSEPAARKLRDSWNEIHAGLNNSHKVAILEEGMKYTAIGINARDSQLLETRQFEVREIANWIGVPPHKLGDSSRTAYNSLEQENQSYLDEALDPWLVAFEEEAYDKLLTEDEKRSDTHTVEFKRQALLRADTAARGEFYNKATGGLPWMTGNEVRGRENLNPMEGFDTIKLPTNNWGDQANIQAGEAARAVMLDAVRRVAKRLAVHARKASKSPIGLSEWLELGMRNEHFATISETVAVGCSVVTATMRRHLDPGDVANAIMDVARDAFVSPVPMTDAWESDVSNAIASKCVAELIGAK